MNPLMQQLSGETLQESPETLVKKQRELPLYFLLFQ